MGVLGCKYIHCILIINVSALPNVVHHTIGKGYKEKVNMQSIGWVKCKGQRKYVGASCVYVAKSILN